MFGLIDKKKFILFFLILVISFLKIWMVSSQEIVAVPSITDDFLFIRHAYFLTHGQWLGNYDNFTLVKYPFYGFFIAFNYYTGIPLLISQQIMYLLSGLYGLSLLHRFNKNIYFLAIFFLVYAFNPVTYSCESNHTFREGVYQSLTSFLIIGFLQSFVFNNSLKTKIIHFIIMSCSFSAFYLTKEDNFTILPSIFVLAILLIIRYFYIDKTKRSLKQLFLWLIPFCFLWLCVHIVSSKNLKYYKLYCVVDSNGAFEYAIKQLIRVNPSTKKENVPLSADTRKELYQKIPSFSELSTFEDNVFYAWAEHKPACLSTPSICDEVVKLTWSIRSAVSAVGYYSNAKSASRYYERLSKEIDFACNNGTLNCSNIGIYSQLNNFQLNKLPQLVSKIGESASLLINYKQVDIVLPGIPEVSYGDDMTMKIFKEMSNNRLFPTELELNNHKNNFPEKYNKYKIMEKIVPFYKYYSLFATILLTFIVLFLLYSHFFTNLKLHSNLVISFLVIFSVIFIRVFILAYIEVFIAQAIRVSYMAPAYPLLILLCFLIFSQFRHLYDFLVYSQHKIKTT